MHAVLLCVGSTSSVRVLFVRCPSVFVCLPSHVMFLCSLSVCWLFAVRPCAVFVMFVVLCVVCVPGRTCVGLPCISVLSMLLPSHVLSVCSLSVCWLFAACQCIAFLHYIFCVVRFVLYLCVDSRVYVDLLCVGFAASVRMLHGLCPFVVECISFQILFCAVCQCAGCLPSVRVLYMCPSPRVLTMCRPFLF